MEQLFALVRCADGERRRPTMLVDMVAKGGNFPLNVGPDAPHQHAPRPSSGVRRLD